ncbi:MAG: hypothetical protein HY822_07810 [Acidobacteria bacterium]|nr:hypothetical protein [Acidobacteriota bacterium]
MSTLTRRECAGSVLFALAAPSGWSREWDQALIQAAVARQDAAFDPAETMLRRSVGAEYRYHTNLRSRQAHPTRDTLEYAFLLLEAGGDQRRERSLAVIERILAIQETDPQSKWYGIWGYYLEEPAPKMSPADWNWADFNGSMLLLIEYRHGSRLPAALREKVRAGIHHAAYSVRRRNVAMTYTNIAVQGSFVTLAGAQLLGDADLGGYAADRLRRFAQTVDVTGSFAEYNSPSYANVTIANLTRMKRTLKDPEILARVDKIHHRAWLHLARHWHAATRQLAGPLSRCYSTDIGGPLWIQKALGGRLAFTTLADVRQGRASGSGEVATLDYRCPEALAPLFLEPGQPRQHRETFLPAEPPVRPVQGTTWLDRGFCLGSVNRGDFWVQRRSLLAYWGGAARPARYLQMRFIKDDYDFTSALLYAVQERNCILGLINFRTPGGDKHPSLDPIQNGEFQARRLRLCLDLPGVPEKARIVSDASTAAIDLGGARLWFRAQRAVFGERTGRLSVAREEGRLVVSVDLLREPEPRLVRWSEIGPAYIAFTLAMEEGSGAPEALDRRYRRLRFEESREGPTVKLAWQSLALTGGTAVRSVAEQDRAFSESINGAPVPLVRLSEERLA